MVSRMSMCRLTCIDLFSVEKCKNGFLGLNDLSGLPENENSSQQLQNHNACKYNKIFKRYYRNFN